MAAYFSDGDGGGVDVRRRTRDVDGESDVAVAEPKLGRSVSIDQAANLLNVSRRTIYNRIREGRLQTIRTIGGSQRVLLESLFDMGFRPQPFSSSASSTAFAIRPVLPRE